MFKVRFVGNDYVTGLINGKTYKVFDVLNGNFLVFEEARKTDTARYGESSPRSEWSYQSAKYFIPVED